MKNRTTIVIPLLVALAAGLWCVSGCGPREETRLVHAWQLTPDGAYDGEPMRDPVVSWSPDSRSMVFTVVARKTYKSSVMQWNVGDERVTRVTYGGGANYVDNDTVLLYNSNPPSIIERNLKTGRVRQIASDLRKIDLYREITGFTYNPVNKNLELRFSNFTRYYEPGCKAVDLAGKDLGNIPRATGDGVLDRGRDPKGGRSAVILGDLTTPAQELRISPEGQDTKGELIAAGNLGAVAWSPDGRVVAFAQANTVKTLDPKDKKIVTVARFGKLTDTGDQPYVCRLNWSPDGNYLAATEILPIEGGMVEMIYVLDMSKVQR